MNETKVKLSRKVAQWENCDPDKMVTYQSQQATIFAMRDAKHDLRVCFRRIGQLETEIETFRRLKNVDDKNISKTVDQRECAAIADELDQCNHQTYPDLVAPAILERLLADNTLSPETQANIIIAELYTPLFLKIKLLEAAVSGLQEEAADNE